MPSLSMHLFLASTKSGDTASLDAVIRPYNYDAAACRSPARLDYLPERVQNAVAEPER